ncbi:hypothetical protein QYF61_000287 [Mycteria americana]|uniref:Reverse transcriptase domain-containing protein n=1 Tax=Mycteria americana TaxID=33587 RepID=A0AAN7NQH9_MYCAM|nr:hypothetical protein QYF61_000287 [Mycteria americana]
MSVLVDEERAVDIVYLDFSKAFNTVSCKFLMEKLMRYGLNDQTVRVGTLSKSADDTKLGGVADMPEGFTAIQKDLNRLKKGADRNLMVFNEEKCSVLHLGRNNSRHQNRLGDKQLESSFAEKDLGVLVDTKWNVSQWQKPMNKKNIRIHSLLNKISSGRWKKSVQNPQSQGAK